MARFLTGHARIEQTTKKRYWRLIDNELFQDSNGDLFLTPRNMVTDNYTIPCWIAWLAGSPVDYDTRASHLHDSCCYFHKKVKVLLTVEQLKTLGYLYFYEKKNIWVCKDIPVNFLVPEKISMKETNDLLYRALIASGAPEFSAKIIRIGVFFNIGWPLSVIFGRIKSLNLKKYYNREWWNELLGVKE